MCIRRSLTPAASPVSSCESARNQLSTCCPNRGPLNPYLHGRTHQRVLSSNNQGLDRPNTKIPPGLRCSFGVRILMVDATVLCPRSVVRCSLSSVPTWGCAVGAAQGKQSNNSLLCRRQAVKQKVCCAQNIPTWPNQPIPKKGDEVLTRGSWLACGGQTKAVRPSEVPPVRPLFVVR